jgi:hypothetical protein
MPTNYLSHMRGDVMETTFSNSRRHEEITILLEMQHFYFPLTS